MIVEQILRFHPRSCSELLQEDESSKDAREGRGRPRSKSKAKIKFLRSNDIFGLMFRILRKTV